MRTWRKKNVRRRSCCSRFIASTPVTVERRTVRKRAADEMRTSFSFCCHRFSIMWVNASSCRSDITTQWLMMAISEKKVMMMSKMLPNLSPENWIVDLVELWCFILVDNRVSETNVVMIVVSETATPVMSQKRTKGIEWSGWHEDKDAKTSPTHGYFILNWPSPHYCTLVSSLTRVKKERYFSPARHNTLSCDECLQLKTWES